MTRDGLPRGRADGKKKRGHPTPMKRSKAKCTRGKRSKKQGEKIFKQLPTPCQKGGMRKVEADRSLQCPEPTAAALKT